MTGGREAERRPGRAPLRRRSRRRWAVAGGIAAAWVVLELMTGSVVSATVLLVILAGLGAVTVGGLRALGVTRDHPWLRRMASRPRRDGEDVLKVAMRHLPAHPDLPDLQYADAPELAYAAAPRAYPEPAGHAWHEPDPGLTAAVGMATVMEWSVAPVPVLRLITGSAVAETRMSGARAGRGSVELVLPNEPTVSREHARFTFSDGRWRITNQGRNGLTLNGAPVTGDQPLSDGDAIRWGTRPDALLSRVEII